MVLINQAGNIVLVNTQAERLFGYRREELLGQTIVLVRSASETNIRASARAFSSILECVT